MPSSSDFESWRPRPSSACSRGEILPLWKEYKAAEKFVAASLTPVEGGGQASEGVRDYILHVEVPGMAEHEQFDADPRFLQFLARAREFQQESPLVWFGTTRFQV